jgi:hypothetical protein
VVVHQRERHSGIVGVAAMDRPPGGEGGLVFLLPVKRSQAGMTQQLGLPLSRRRLNWYRRAAAAAAVGRLFRIEIRAGFYHSGSLTPVIGHNVS